jgi:3'(2'), 5'-bisphosphate nucleotidase
LNLIPDIYITALKAIVEASQVILDIYNSDFQAITKEDGSPVTQADLQSSQVISEFLQSTDLPMIGEEQEIANYQERKDWGDYWCIDPLDGTRMFLKRNDEFAINIAHIQHNYPIFGIIGNPVKKEILIGGVDYGVFLMSFEDIENPANWKKLQSLNYKSNPVRIICSRSYTHGSGFKYVQNLERKYGELFTSKKDHL